MFIYSYIDLDMNGEPSLVHGDSNVPFLSLLNGCKIDNNNQNTGGEIDYDENGSDNEELEVRDARDKTKH